MYLALCAPKPVTREYATGVELTATVGLQAKTALAMPVCPPETRTFF
jgi:hypothetical protein